MGSWKVATLRFGNAPNNVKPRGGGMGKGGRATHRNLTVTYIPRVGLLIGHHAFDLSISNSRRKVNHLLLLILHIDRCIIPRESRVTRKFQGNIKKFRDSKKKLGNLKSSWER